MSETAVPGQALARLLCFASPAFPTGGFAYSHGLEWAVEAGDVRDQASLLGWLSALLAHGSGRTDAILLRHAHRASLAAGDPSGLAELALAACGSRERQVESLGQGTAFAASALAWAGLPQAPREDAYPVAFGAAAAQHGITEDAACTGYLCAWCGNLVSAGVRLVPLGQSAGLAVLAVLEPILLSVASKTRGTALHDIGTACFRGDIAAMRHETQYSRMFRS